jgi:hypothetical protein
LPLPRSSLRSRIHAGCIRFCSTAFLYAESFSGKIVATTDGDTIKVMHNGQAEGSLILELVKAGLAWWRSLCQARHEVGGGGSGGAEGEAGPVGRREPAATVGVEKGEDTIA